MDALARPIREHYLKLEGLESAPLSPRCESQIERAQKLSLERRDRFIKALRVEVEGRGVSFPRFFQTFAGSVILRNGEPFWGRYWIDGNYYANEASVWRARRLSLERAHNAALREDAARQRHIDAQAHTAPTGEKVGTAELGRSLVASIAIAAIRYEVTPEGRKALKSSTLKRSRKTGSDTTPSDLTSGTID